MKSFYLTDAGKVRDHNEDSVIIVSNKDNDYLMAIADGMGGHSAGEVASSIAINYLGKHFKDTFMNMYLNMRRLIQKVKEWVLLLLWHCLLKNIYYLEMLEILVVL